MRCGTIREALSARLDGEDRGLPDDDIDAHLGGCERCRAWALAAGALAGVVERGPRDQLPLDPAVLVSLTAPADEAATGLLRTGDWRVVLAPHDRAYDRGLAGGSCSTTGTRRSTRRTS